MEVYMGTILPFAFNYPPYGFALCYGQQYSVGQYQALYSLLGIFYGGNGTTTFNLPNLSGRMLIGSGPAQPDINMPAHNVGAKGGNSIVALTTANMPIHTHGTSNLKAQLLAGGTPNPATPASKPSTQAPFIGASSGGTGLANIWSTTLTDPVSVGGMGMSGNLDPAGGSAPISITNPFLAINFCIAIEGLYPPHND